MCGIAGIVSFAAESPVLDSIESLTRGLAHRGPDGHGIWRSPHVALGHRRLSIIDLPGGAQPLGNEDGSIQITFNGEIYNYRELRQRLVAAGHTFRTDSDTEVLVHAYEQWGRNFLLSLRGMYAFCLVDLNRQNLLLVRDPFGIKPLVYRTSPGRFAFASEIGPLAELGPPPDGSLQALDYYLRYQYIPAPGTIYHDIFKLPPGCPLWVSFAGGVGKAKPFVNYGWPEPPATSEGDVLAEVETALADCVTTHLTADVPVGVWCSGGLDSAVVAKFAARSQPNLQAFALGFSNANYCELKYAEQVAQRYGLAMQTATIDETALDWLPEIVRRLGEPFGDSSLLPTWHLAEMTRNHVKVVLSGDGGDEFFAGYDTYLAWLGLTAAEATDVAPSTWQRWRERLGGFKQRLLMSNRVERWQQLVGYIPAAERRALWRTEFHAQVDVACPAFENAGKYAPRDPLAFAQAMDAGTYLPSCILTKVDLAGMAHGLEVRPPLCDVRLARVAMSLPSEWRIARQAGGRGLRKAALRAILADELPEIVQRPKRGFAMPRQQWLQPGTRWHTQFRDLVLDPAVGLCEWFERQELQRIFATEDGTDRSGHRWLLGVLALWRATHPKVTFR